MTENRNVVEFPDKETLQEKYKPQIQRFSNPITEFIIEMSPDQFYILKSITNDVNEKYFEMGGDNYTGWINLPRLVQEIFDKGFELSVEYEDIREKHFREIENEIEKEQERNN